MAIHTITDVADQKRLHEAREGGRLLAAALLVVAGISGPARAWAQEAVASSVLPADVSLVLPLTEASGVLFPVGDAVEAGPNAVPESSASLDLRRPAALPALYASTVLLQVLDAHSTLTAIEHGAHEANPLMQDVAAHPGALVAVKAGVAAGMIYLAEKNWRRHPVAVVVMMVVFNTVQAIVVAHNYKVASTARWSP
jgi:Domain of unknown function (DUF5658)